MHVHGLGHYFSKAVHHRHSESSVLYHTSSLDVWPGELADKPDRFVDKIESCSAHTMTAAHDGCPGVVAKEHLHTFLRVTLAPTKDHPEETVFVERVLAEQGRPMHSVIPVAADVTSVGGRDTLHDHACVILEGSPSAMIHSHHLKIDRTIHFSRCPDRHLSLYELATLLRFISEHGLRAVSIGLDTACETYSKWFSRATMSALAPVIMRGAFRQLTPPKEAAGVQVEIAMQRSVDAWMKSTFKAYPLEAVAAENLTRQMNAMNGDEMAKKMVQIAERDKTMVKKAMVQAAYHVFKTAELERVQAKKEGITEKLTRKQSFKREEVLMSQMMEAALQIYDEHPASIQSRSSM